jgi:hypothetical protein
MCQLDRERHQLHGLIAREPEHEALVSGAACIDPHCDVRRLLIDCRQDGARIAIETVLGARITYFSNGFTCHLRKIDLRVRSNFAGNDDQTRRHERLARDTPGTIL